MSLLDDLISAITGISGLTGKNGHVYGTSDVPGVVLVTEGQSKIIEEGLTSNVVERPFELKLFAKDQSTLDTFFTAIKGAINKSITNGFWKIYNEEPDPTEIRRNLIISGKQVKIE